MTTFLVLSRRYWFIALASLLVISFGACAAQNTGNSNNSSSSSKQGSAETSVSVNWYEGGTLHRATVSSWRSATYGNKLATAADFLTATLWKGQLKSPDDFDRLKLKATMLVAAIDDVATVELTASLDVAEIASGIFLLGNDLGP
ncbi:MAG: hypothetical protein HQ475_08060 [SAR202 cluster bacterium]|nr:hypothetical protein [SAR202 cluster bacterium]